MTDRGREHTQLRVLAVCGNYINSLFTSLIPNTMKTKTDKCSYKCTSDDTHVTISYLSSRV